MSNELRRGRERGFSLVELCAAMALAAAGLLALAGVLIATSKVHEQSVVQRTILDGTVTVMEQMRGTDPDMVQSTYDDLANTVYVTGVPGCEGMSIATEVDDTEDDLLTITVSTDWTTGNAERSLGFESRVYDATE